MLLEELAKKTELNIDFHNHGQTGSDFRKKEKGLLNKVKGALLSEGYDGLPQFLSTLFNSDTDVLYLTNFSDSRFEDWTSEEQLELAVKTGYEIELGEYYVFAKKGNKIKAIGKSQEVPTKQGHMLFAGVRRDKKFSDGKTISETLSEANDDELKIADHPYCGIPGQNGIMTKSGSLIEKFKRFYYQITKQKDKLAKIENPEGDLNKVDCFERNGNFYFPFFLPDWKARHYAKKHNKPLLTDADGHHPKDIGNCYNIFQSKDLKYSSERAFRDSINYAVRNNNFETNFSPVPIYRIFHHFMMIVMNKLLKFYK